MLHRRISTGITQRISKRWHSSFRHHVGGFWPAIDLLFLSHDQSWQQDVVLQLLRYHPESNGQEVQDSPGNYLMPKSVQLLHHLHVIHGGDQQRCAPVPH
jgi:hypothetical protein